MKSTHVRHVQLTPPALENANRGGQIGCVRSMRLGGPRIDAEVRDDQLVTHAYGFGGGGWTLAPGAAQHAVACFEAAQKHVPARANNDVAIVGGGVLAMWVANLISAHGDLGDINVYGENLSGLASHNAGGLLAPVSLGITLEQRPDLQSVAVDAWHQWSAIADCHAKTRPWEQRGARTMDAYDQAGRLDNLVPYIKAGVMPPPEPVRLQFGPTGPSYEMERYQTMFMNTQAMMRELHSGAARAGVTVYEERVRQFGDLDEPIVFNCAGLGAADLAGDKAMVPVLGHLIKLQNQPAFKTDLQYIVGGKFDGGPCYYIPKLGDGTQGVVGGSFIEGEGDRNAAPETFDQIWHRARKFYYGDRLS